MIKNGTQVKVVDEGVLFPIYEAMAEIMELTDWNHGRKVLPGHTFRVIAKSFHDATGEVVYGIEDGNGKQFLIGEKGIKVLPKDPIVYHFRMPNKTKGGFTVYYLDGRVGVAKCAIEDNFCRSEGAGLASWDWMYNVSGESFVHLPKKFELLVPRPSIFNDKQLSLWRKFYKEYMKEAHKNGQEK